MTDEKPGTEENPELPTEPTWQERKDAEIRRSLAKVKAIIEHGQSTKPPTDHPIPADDPAERLLAVNREAWISSLQAADVSDLVGHRLEGLAKDQHANALRDFVTSIASGNPVKRNLILAGVVGPGKTSAAIATGWAALAAGRSVRFVEHSKYLLWLRPDQMPSTGPYRDLTPHRLRARMRASDVLIVDDLGASLDPRVPVTQFVKDETLTLIGDRIDTPGRVTIITTNHTAAHLEAMFGEQFMSRLAKSGAVLKFTGKDRRGRLSW